MATAIKRKRKTEVDILVNPKPITKEQIEFLNKKIAERRKKKLFGSKIKIS